MPNLSVTALVKDTDRNELLGKQNLSVVTTGALWDGGGRIIGTTEETITFSTDVGNAGLLYVENLDPTNFVELGFAAGVRPIKLLPQSVPFLAVLMPAQAAIYVKADTATCNIIWHVREA